MRIIEIGWKKVIDFISSKMKYLTIIRHADAPFLDINQLDYDRNLSNIGFKDADYIGKKLYNSNVIFDLMITSTAKRALNTCQMIAVNTKYSFENIQKIKKIYSANVDDLCLIISKTSSKIKSLAVVGHNPAVKHLYEKIVNSKINYFPTCFLVHISIETDNWNNWIGCDNQVLFTLEPVL